MYKTEIINCIDPTPSPTSTGCYPQGPCDDGFMDQTNGDSNYWACGEDCVGGKHHVDDGCGCACIPDSTCNPTSSPSKEPTYHPTQG